MTHDVFSFWQYDGAWPTPAPGERIPVYLRDRETVTTDKAKAHPLFPDPIGEVAAVDNPEPWRGYVRIEMTTVEVKP